MKLSTHTVWLLIALSVLTPCGCGGPTPTQPGSRGVLWTREQPLPDVRVTFHRRHGGESELVGFGITNDEGEFRLFLEDASGPLWLEPDEYAITLESAGSEPFVWPPEYLDPLRTPLVFNWDGLASLDLEVPEPTALGAMLQTGKHQPTQ